MPKILAFAGSTRAGSINRRLVEAIVPLLEAKGAHVTSIDLKDYEMPLYNGDLEERDGVPEGARRLKRLMAEHDGLLIGSPEYNGGFTPLLKNTLDWCSRRETDDPAPLVAYAGKTAAIVSASGGKFGGMRGLVHLRQILVNLGVLVIPQQVAVGNVYEVLGEDGSFNDPTMGNMIGDMARALVQVSRLSA